ncbi:MAG TPA: PH domain-containing protein [Thermoanaerobaculia bacterium]|nr:PH domain-containing protein [Thermoanaerobaculia bacterium]
MRFESKRDLWLVLLLRVMPIVLLLIVGDVWYLQHHDLRGPIAGAIILIVVEIFFFETILRSTYYVIEADTLTIRSSFITWRVPIRDIRSITPTRSAISSPALSLDRLRIEYGRKWILVSPEDRQRFIAALRSVNPAISV